MVGPPTAAAINRSRELLGDLVRLFAQLPTRDDRDRIVDFLLDFHDIDDQHHAENILINETLQRPILTILANAADDARQKLTGYVQTTDECATVLIVELDAIFTDFKQAMNRVSTHEGRLRLEAEVEAKWAIAMCNFDADHREKVSRLVTLSDEKEACFHREYDIWQHTQNSLYEKQFEELAQFAAKTFAGTNVNAVRFPPQALVFEVKPETDPAGFCDALLWLK